MNESPARIHLAADGSLYCEGNWTLNYLASLEQQIALLRAPESPRIVCEAGNIETMDTGGAWLLRRTLNDLEEQKGCSVSLTGLSPDFAALMQTAAKNWPGTELARRPTEMGWLEKIGRFVGSYGPRA